MSLNAIVIAQGNKDLSSQFEKSPSLLEFVNIQINSNDVVNNSNDIYIQQIGNYNHLNSYTNSIRSKINLVQIGNNNGIQLGINSTLINETVIQKGNQHLFFDYSLKKTMLHSANVIQIGNNQRLFWQGANSISEKMLITMKGNNQAIFIRNIK